MSGFSGHAGLRTWHTFDALSRAHARLPMYRLWPLLLAFLFVSAPMPSLAQKAAPTAQRAAFQPPTGQDIAAANLRLKDPGRAVWYSAGATVLLAPAFGAGIIVGPAAGHFYAGNSERAWKGIGTRAGAAAAPILLAEAATLGGNDGAAEGFQGLGVFLLSGAVAVGVIGYSAIRDIATADDSAREYNRAHGPTSANLRVAPTIGGPQGEQVGLTMQVEF